MLGRQQVLGLRRKNFTASFALYLQCELVITEAEVLVIAPALLLLVAALICRLKNQPGRNHGVLYGYMLCITGWNGR